MPLTLPVSSSDHTKGDLNAPLTIVHYGDFECPYSAAAAAVMEEVEKELGEKLLYVFRPFPLADIHPTALYAAEAAEAAAAQGKFWEMYEILFANQDQLNKAVVNACAGEVGLDMERFGREMSEQTYRKTLAQSVVSGRESGVHGTPTFFVNGQFYDNRHGMWEPEIMFLAIEDALGAGE